MKILVDTHVLLWWLESSKQLGRTARTALSDPENEVWISAASIWEISIKSGLGLLRFRETPEKGISLLEAQGFRQLSITFEHALAVRNLPLHHKDPFDRLLIAQAGCEKLTLLSADPQIFRYPVPFLDASRQSFSSPSCVQPACRRPPSSPELPPPRRNSERPASNAAPAAGSPRSVRTYLLLRWRRTPWRSPAWKAALSCLAMPLSAFRSRPRPTPAAARPDRRRPPSGSRPS